MVFDTGRAVPELAEQIALLPEVRYAIFCSGAGLYDTREKKAFGLQPIPAAQTERILSVSRTKDIMPQLVLADRDVIQASHMERLEHYNMGVYRPMYEKAMTLVPDIYAFAESCKEPYLKINLYHAEVAERIRTRAQLETPDLELVYSEISSLECSASGVSKGSGLERLCSLLDIPLEACIAVGDADNDIPMLRAAGLGIAMGNAPEHVKTAAARMSAIPLDKGDASFQFEIMPGYEVRLIVWEGDDEFPPNSQMLFSDNFPKAFSAEDRTVVGDILISDLIERRFVSKVMAALSYVRLHVFLTVNLLNRY